MVWEVFRLTLPLLLIYICPVPIERCFRHIFITVATKERARSLSHSSRTLTSTLTRRHLVRQWATPTSLNGYNTDFVLQICRLVPFLINNQFPVYFNTTDFQWCLLKFTYVYDVYKCMFTYFYPYLLLFSYVYTCLFMFTPVYLCLQMFTRVYLCLPLFTLVYLCLPMFTPVFF